LSNDKPTWLIIAYESAYGILAGVFMAVLLLLLGIYIFPGLDIIYLLILVGLVGVCFSFFIRKIIVRQNKENVPPD
jgi:hypothetical protein